VEAPVMTPTLKSRPAACSAMAFSAMAEGITLAAPAGVNPLKPMFSSCLMKAAASSGVRTGNGGFMIGKAGRCGRGAGYLNIAMK
jgi:hypothetical protein